MTIVMICRIRSGHAWSEHSKKVLEAAGFVESRPEQGLYYLPGHDRPEAIAHTHVDDVLIAFRKASKTYKDALQHLLHTLCLKQQSGTVLYCGRTIAKDGSHMKVKKAKSTLGLEYLIIDLARQTLESALTSAEITGYRSVWGHLLWLGKQSRPDLCVGVSWAAQGVSKATLSDVKARCRATQSAWSSCEHVNVRVHALAVGLQREPPQKSVSVGVLMRVVGHVGSQRLVWSRGGRRGGEGGNGQVRSVRGASQATGANCRSRGRARGGRPRHCSESGRA